MLTITIPASEQYSETTNEFTYVKASELRLEHSLVSLAKWEAKWKKPFLSDAGLTDQEFLDYIRCMTLTQHVDPNVYRAIPAKELRKIQEYLRDPMTATTISKLGNAQPGRREIVTAEVIYYWMIQYKVPFECQKWHLNRLLTLIRVCSAKSQAPKKMSNKEIMAQNRALNAARKLQFHTRG